MMLREYFYGTPRELQITALKQIEEAIQQGYHNIVISAPTGVGKSYIAIALALAFKEGDILTATVQLQEQYLRDFPFIRSIMGRKNFICPVYDKPCSTVPTIRCRGMKHNSSSNNNNNDIDEDTGNNSDSDNDSNISSNSDNNNSNSSSPYIIHPCTLYPTKEDLKQIHIIGKGTSNERAIFNAKYKLCDYYIQKHIAYRSSFRIINYHEYFTLLNNTVTRDRLSTKLLVCDEAHMLESKIIDFYNIILDNRLLRPLRKYNLVEDTFIVEYRDSIIYYTDILEYLTTKYRELIKIVTEKVAEIEGRDKCSSSSNSSNNSSNSNSNSNKNREKKKEKNKEYRRLLYELAEYEERVQRLSTVLGMLKENPENFIIDVEEEGDKDKERERKYEEHKPTVKLLPLNVATLLKSVFDRVKYRIFMSATIDYPMLKRELGLNDKDTILIDLPSPFPIQNRKVLLMNAYSLNKENMHSESMLMQVASTIDTIMNKHNKERGLILTTSYELAGNIFRYSNNKHRLLLTKDMSAKEVLEKHSNTDGNVILTPTFWEGVDLRDDLCRFIVIAKTPYPSLAAKRIRIKAERDKEWYKSVTLMRLIQGAGRGVRHEQDYCITYVLDSNATWLILSKAKQNAVPRWFKDAIVYNNSSNNNGSNIPRTNNSNNSY